MKNLIFLLSAIAVVLFIESCDQKLGKKPIIDENAVVFVKNGIEGGMAEIKVSGLAITNSNNQRVIAFAKMLIEDHTATLLQLKKLETDKQVNEIDTLSWAHRQLVDSLSTKYNAAFDGAYMRAMLADHEQAIKFYTTASTNTDADIKKIAGKTLPTLQMHLDSAKAILAGLK